MARTRRRRRGLGLTNPTHRARAVSHIGTAKSHAELAFKEMGKGNCARAFHYIESANSHAMAALAQYRSIEPESKQEKIAGQARAVQAKVNEATNAFQRRCLSAKAKRR